MAVYFMPPDVREKEKIVGGLFTWNQAGWLVGGFVLGLTTFVIMFSVSNVAWLSLFFAILMGSLTLPFVFVKRSDLTLFQYLMRKRKFNKKSKHLINKKAIRRKIQVGMEEEM